MNGMIEAAIVMLVGVVAGWILRTSMWNIRIQRAKDVQNLIDHLTRDRNYWYHRAVGREQKLLDDLCLIEETDFRCDTLTD